MKWQHRLTTFLIIGLLGIGFHSASNPPGHVYVALMALKRAPAAIKDILGEVTAIEAYLCGADGPDIANTAHLIAEALGEYHPGSEAHYYRTGRLIMQMLDQWREIGNEHEARKMEAFALGWLTHYCMDIQVHALINKYGGYYGAATDPGKHQTRHKRLELVECEHALSKNVGIDHQYTLNINLIPFSQIVRAFYRTYPETNDRFGLGFKVDLIKSAELRVIASNWIVDIHACRKWATNFPFAQILKGAPPTPEEYKLLMEPLILLGGEDKPGIEYPDRAAGESEACLTFKYTINDFKLNKLFIQDWDEAAERAISEILKYFKAYAEAKYSVEDDPTFHIPDYNLDTGKPLYEGAIGDSEFHGPEWPGNPDIRELLVHLKVTDPMGCEVSGWPADGQFVIVPFAPTAHGAAYPAGPTRFESGTIEKLDGWNKLGAGSAYVKVYFDPGDARDLKIDLRLVMANPEDKRPYGYPEKGRIIEAVYREEPDKQPVDLVFCVDVTGSMRDDIDAVRSKVKTVLNELKGITDDLRVKLVTFGDLNAEEEDRGVIRTTEFTRDTSVFQGYLDGIVMQGGGDRPESVNAGLMAGLNSSWRDGVRKLVILIGDAPGHVGTKARYTADEVAKRSLEVDPADIFPIAVADGGRVREDTLKFFGDVAKRNRGEVFTTETADDLPEMIMTAVGRAIDRSSPPVVSGGGAIVSRSGFDWGPVALGLLLMSILALAAGIIILTRRSASGSEKNRGRLEVTYADGGRKTHPIRQTKISIGREAGSSLVLNDPSVSLRHAEIYVRDRQFHIKDLGSANGILVNGKRVSKSPLYWGDAVRLGSTELRLLD